MKQTPLGPGRKALERGSTFPPRSSSLQSNPKGSRGTLKTGKGFTPCSPEQREKVKGVGSIVSGEGPCDPCHLTSRQHGGCDHEDCVFPLTRQEHRAFDDGDLDVLPYLIAHNLWVELAHAVLVHHYDPVSLAERCTGDRYAPVAS